MTLATILAGTREALVPARRHRDALRAAAESAGPRPSLVSPLRGPDVAVIAEVKRRSPAAGPIAEHLDPAGHAAAYVAGGARAVSVVTEGKHFGGSLADLEAVASRVAVPLLRRDFVIDEIQLWEARIHGASAVPLVVCALDQVALRDLHEAARALGLACLVEVHSLGELDRALDLAPELIDVNARDLTTLSVDVAAIEPVLRAIPPEVVAVAEGGLVQPADVERVAQWGADAVVVGSAVAAAGDPAGAVRAFTGVARRERPLGS